MTFHKMTEVFKRGNMNMEGFVMASFVRMDGTVWYFVEDIGGNWFIAKEEDLREHKRIPLKRSSF